MGRDGVADLDVRIPADAGPARDSQRGDPARRGAEVVVGILGVDPALDRVAADDDLFLA